MSIMKDALLKAGLKASVNKTEAAKAENHRDEIKKKKLTEEIIHQGQRNFCEECQSVRPDVELYYHTNPTTEAEWICVKCADRLKINDSTRQTAQSDTSIKQMFRREHGATRPASEIKVTKSAKPKGEVNGNR